MHYVALCGRGEIYLSKNIKFGKPQLNHSLCAHHNSSAVDKKFLCVLCRCHGGDGLLDLDK